MRIINLIDNNKGDNTCLFEHGLSFYIETDKHKILCDTGQTNAFITNAKALNIDLKAVDTIFLSHGHYDHTGGMLDLSKINNKANIYLSKYASDEYISTKNGAHYIGINKNILNLNNLKLLNNNYIIDEELSIFTNVKEKEYYSFANNNLKILKNNELLADSFIHEQYLVIKDYDKYYLFSGCCHNGIINILNEFKSIYNTYPNYVISGFHFQKEAEFNENERKLITSTANELNKLNIMFYTCHCTGVNAYELMKPILKDKLILIKSGEKIL